MLSYCQAMGKFSENLARIMSERGMNQVELAKKSGISQPRISGYLNESKYAKFPSLKNLVALARALNCTLEELTSFESLRGIEKEAEAVKKLTEEEQALLDAYESLPDDDWRKKAVNKLLLDKEGKN